MNKKSMPKQIQRAKEGWTLKKKLKKIHGIEQWKKMSFLAGNFLKLPFLVNFWGWEICFFNIAP